MSYVDEEENGPRSKLQVLWLIPLIDQCTPSNFLLNHPYACTFWNRFSHNNFIWTMNTREMLKWKRENLDHVFSPCGSSLTKTVWDCDQRRALNQNVACWPENIALETLSFQHDDLDRLNTILHPSYLRHSDSYKQNATPTQYAFLVECSRSTRWVGQHTTNRHVLTRQSLR